MNKQNIRVMIVDDSALIREILQDTFTDAPGIEVVASVNSGEQAIEMIEQCKPDVVTLDIQMPGMDGIETLGKILPLYPVPVVMVSALTHRDAQVTLQALEVGALDYVAKPGNATSKSALWRNSLIQKVSRVAFTDVRRILKIRSERNQKRAVKQPTLGQSNLLVQKTPDFVQNSCIALGISTGGPPALTALFPMLQTPLPPIVIVQHMPAQFTPSFAARLDSISALTVKEAEHGDFIEPNHAYVAPGGRHLELKKMGSKVKIIIQDEAPVNNHKPSVDVMMATAAKIFTNRCLGVIMTGMGRDGAVGCGQIREAGGYVLGQDEASSDIYGMNGAAYRDGNVDQQASLDKLHIAITTQCKRIGRVSRTSHKTSV